MGHSPVAAPAGSFRVVRQHKHVTEAIVAAASAAAAQTAAMALPPQAWTERTILQFDGEDQFEYDVVSSDA